MLRLDTGKSTICSAVFFISALITPNVEKRRTRAYTRAREKGLLFRVHSTFGVMGAEMKKTAEQIVYLPVSDLSIVAN